MTVVEFYAFADLPNTFHHPVQHQQYMHLYSDDQIQAMSADEIKHFLHCHGIHTDDELVLSDLQNQLAKSQRTRTLVLWHLAEGVECLGILC